MKNLFTQKIILFILLLICSHAFFQTSGKFSIVGKTIYDPCGSIFFPVGANLNGPNWVWPTDCKGGADRFKNVWKFNTARINMLLKTGYKNYPTFPEGSNMWSQNNLTRLDEIITEYTAKKIVVQLELHDWTGLYPSGQDLIDLKKWWVMIARKYDDNEYVWFNAFNEPGGHQDNPVSTQYRDVHREIVQAIRDEAGSDNVIVIDGAAVGQEVGGTYNTDLVQEQRSGILTYGNDIINFNNKTYQNIGFSLHVYGQWGIGTDEQRAAKMIDYIDRVHAKGLNLHVGELGWKCSNSTDAEALGTKTAYQIVIDKGIGVLAWHGQPGDRFALPACSESGDILSYSAIPDLSWMGQLMVPIAQQKGAVACSSKTIK